MVGDHGITQLTRRTARNFNFMLSVSENVIDGFNDTRTHTTYIQVHTRTHNYMVYRDVFFLFQLVL